MYSKSNSYKKQEKQKGFLLIEAAIIWPLIMLVLLFVIYVTFSLYNQASSFAVINFASENYDRYKVTWIFKDEVNSTSETYDLISRYNDHFLLPKYELDISTSNNILFKKVSIKQREKHSMILLNKIGTEYRYKNTESEGYILREAEFINKTDIIKENI